jgi:hypothetical protein
MAAAAAACSFLAALPAAGGEIKLHDGTRLAVLVEGYDGQENLQVYLTSGEKKLIPLRDVAAITFSGRPEYFIRTGDQKLLMSAGGHICGKVEGLDNGDTLRVLSQSLGRHSIPLRVLHGMAALAVEGRAVRLAEDLMTPDGVPATPDHAFLDHVLDRRGVPYAGVIETLDPIRLQFEHDEQLQPVRMDTFKVAGIRLAEAGKDKAAPPDPIDVLQVGVICRDGSCVAGALAAADPFQWKIRPSFDPKRVILVPASEITGVEVMGGRSVFLSQLNPVKVEEKTVVAPPQPFRRNSNSLGESMDIGGFVYQKGVGVHAMSRLTYRLGGKFKVFKADVGIDGRLETAGRVVFAVLGDGKELYRSPVVQGRCSGGGLAIDLPVEGVNEMTLYVDPTEDLDQSDVANWGAARVLR